jgi:cell cycle checkpoint control protein RAD9A
VEDEGWEPINYDEEELMEDNSKLGWDHSINPVSLCVSPA